MNNPYNKQINEIISYFIKNEKAEKDFRIGVEFEHFIVDKKTLRTINYYEEKGIREILEDLKDRGWEGNYEEGHLIGLSKADTHITLEPGAQLEISIEPHINIEDIEKEYLDFLGDIIPILENNGQLLIAIGYHPESSIDDIPFIPKKRYKYMAEYFETRGRLAHNMMKGTAATQVTIDYGSEDDYRKKFKLINILSPVIGIMFDNGPFFEGSIYNKCGIRTDIWENCDSDRCGVIEGIFKEDYGYKDYAEYLLNTPPIIVNYNGNFEYTKNTPFKDLFDTENYTIDYLEHIMTMVFPDVRTKKFIEIRMADSVPYPLNLSMVALWKGLLYNSENLEHLYTYLRDITYEDIVKCKEDLLINGLMAKLRDMPVYDIGLKLIKLSKEALGKEEKYLLALEELYLQKKTPSQRTKDLLYLGKAEAIKWCVLNDKLKR